MIKESDIMEFLLKNNIDIGEETSTQFVLDCPSCGRENKVYMGKSNGVWDCKVCGSKGNIHTFKKATKVEQRDDTLISRTTVERYVQLLRGNDAAQDYLFNRKFTGRVVTQTQIGCNENGDIAFPFRDRKGELVAIKYRNLQFEKQTEKYETLRAQNLEAPKPRKWYSVGQPGLWGVDTLDMSKPVILTEGEWDRVALLEYGIENVASVPGATNRNWLDDIKDAKQIYIVFDNDAAGSNGAFELASRLGLSRCYKVEITEHKDCNDALLHGFTAEQFKGLIAKATKFPVAGISSSDRFSDLVIDELLNPDRMRGIPTGYPKLDGYTKGFAGQELRIISGWTSTGKTTWAMNEMLLYAQQGAPVAVFSLETPVRKVIKDMLQQVSDVPLNTLNKEQLEDKVKKLGQLPMYWFDSRNFEDAFTIAKFKDLVRQTRDRYGIKFVVLDDLDFLVSSSQKYQNENEVVSTLMTELKTLANTLNIHIIVIAHIVKSAGEGIPRMRDIKGSGAIMQRADYVMLIHRETAADADENLKADVTVVLEKNRPGGETGLIHYRYDKVTRRYRED